jgi:hypothetical protein
MIPTRKVSSEPRTAHGEARRRERGAANDSTISPLPPARTGRKGRNLPSLFVLVEATYELRA